MPTQARRAPPWPRQTLEQALARAAREWRDAEALVIAGRRLSYRELEQSAHAVARALRAAGIGHGDHVAVCMGNAIEWVQFFYGAAIVGAVTVPVNTRFKPDELAYCLGQADVKLLFTADRFLKIDFIAMLRQICPALEHALPDQALPQLRNVVVLGDDVPAGALECKQWLARGADAPAVNASPVGPDDVLLMQFTSGTTSYPKGVMLSHDNMLRNAACVAPRFDCRAGDRYYSARPFYHVAGTTLSMLAALASGATLLSSPHFEAGEALRLMAEERCTITSGNDTMFLMMCNHPEFGRYAVKLKSGWASAGPEASRQVIERMGMRGLCHAYGLSEASPNVCMSWFDDDVEERIGGRAHVLDDVEVEIRDPNSGRAQPPGQPGEILVRGVSVMKGYYKMPEATAQAIDADGWLHSGDLGVMDGDGRLRFLTRIKDVFRVGGENVAPAEVEDVLNRHPKIKQAQVIGVPDPRLARCRPPTLFCARAKNCQRMILLRGAASAWPVSACRATSGSSSTFENIGMTGSAKVQKNKLRAQALVDFGLEQKKYS